MANIKEEPGEYEYEYEEKIKIKRSRPDPMLDSTVYTIWNTKVGLSQIRFR